METIDWLIEADPNKFSVKELIASKIIFRAFNRIYNSMPINYKTLNEIEKIKLVQHYKQLIRMNLKSLAFLLEALP